MLHMTTYQSWQTVVVLVAIVAAVIWLLVQLEKRRQWRLANEAPETFEDDETGDHPTTTRHLTLVPRPAPQPLYDWEKQGV